MRQGSALGADLEMSCLVWVLFAEVAGGMCVGAQRTEDSLIEQKPNQ